MMNFNPFILGCAVLQFGAVTVYLYKKEYHMASMILWYALANINLLFIKGV